MSTGEGMAGRVALITGATSGIGQAIARRLATSGCALALNYLRSDHVASALEGELTMVPVRVLRADVSDAHAVDELVATTVGAFGRIDYLVNVASYSRPDLWNADPLTLPLEDWEQSIAVDLTGSYLCARSAIPHMLKQGYGKVINFSSSGSGRGDPDTFVYNAAKVGVVGLTKSLARAYAPTVKVNAIAPGSIDSGWIDRWKLTEQEVNNLQALREMSRRLGTCEEVAEAVAFLLAASGDYITGHLLPMDGGLS